MENATKALLIAAAVLVAIIIISLTLVIVRQGQEAVKGADLSEAEAAEFNSKFLSYEGTNVSTSQVNALLNTVLVHNQQEEAAGTEIFVDVEEDEVVILDENDNSIPRKSGNDYYTVTCEYESGLIRTIVIDNPADVINNPPA